MHTVARTTDPPGVPAAPARPGPADALSAVRWTGRFRDYQLDALARLDEARAAGRRRAWLVLPPGAGKTLVGLESARRRGRRVVVFTPTTTIQDQWVRSWRRFAPAAVSAGTARDLRHGVTVLTYQSLAVFEADDAERGGERRAATDRPLLDFLHPNGRALIAALRAAGPLTVVLDECHHLLEVWGRLIADLLDELSGCDVLGLTATPPDSLSAAQGALVERLFGAPIRGAGLPAVVRAGYLAPFAELAYLTAPTPPEAEYIAGQALRFAEFRADLLDPGFCASPFLSWCDARFVERSALIGVQSEAVFPSDDDAAPLAFALATCGPDETAPTRSAGLAVRAARSVPASESAAVAELAAAIGADLPPGRTAAPVPAAVSWSQLERESPVLARAALRLHFDGLLALPPGAQLREEHRCAPTAEDWVALLGDYAAGCLGRSSDPRDAAAVDAIRAALPSIGYQLTRRGVRAAQSPVDRVLARSGAKTDAAVEIAAAEAGELGAQLRALVLCDFESAGATPSARLAGVLDAQAGGARLVLERLAADPRTAALGPLLVTGRGVAADGSTAADFAAWAARQRPGLALSLAPDPDGGAAVRIVAGNQHGNAGAPADAEPDTDTDTDSGADPEASTTAATGAEHLTADAAPTAWTARVWVALATEYFQSGRSRILVGTRALLGEGWDADAVNTLIDLTGAATPGAVVQLRGRGLRLDPRWPEKASNNWTVVCATDAHPKGAADWLRFVRKHEGYLAAAENGEIVSGVGHVDPSFSPYAPPPPDGFAAVNAAMLIRAGRRQGTRELWQVGAECADELVHTIRIRSGRARLARPADRPPLPPPAPSGLALAPGRRLLLRLHPGAAVRLLAEAAGPPPLTAFAYAVADAMLDAGLAPVGAAAVSAAVEPDGSYRLSLSGVPAETSARFARALDELVAPVAEPRWLISRYELSALPPDRRGQRAAARAWLAGRAPLNAVVHHPVPALFARPVRRLDAFAARWRQWISPGSLLNTETPVGAGVLAAIHGASPLDAATALRLSWH